MERRFVGAEGPISSTRVILSADRTTVQFGGLTSDSVIHDGDDYVAFDTSAGVISIYGEGDSRPSTRGRYKLIEEH